MQNAARLSLVCSMWFPLVGNLARSHRRTRWNVEAVRQLSSLTVVVAESKQASKQKAIEIVRIGEITSFCQTTTLEQQ